MNSESADTLQSIPLEAAHIRAGARMAPFGGWNMPLHYAHGIIHEHRHTRSSVSLFDCSHMGQFRITGESVAADLDRMLPRRVSDQRVGTCRYNFLLAEDGTVVDDIIVYRLHENTYFVVVNGGTIDGDANHIRRHLSDGSVFTDASATTGKLDVQGPGAAGVLAQCGLPAGALPRYFRFAETEIFGIPCLISRTGYTGELGFELYFDAARSLDVWTQLLVCKNLEPAGLGARDTLRLEMGYPLYGHELSRSTTPVEAGFGSFIDNDRPYIGADSLQRPPGRRLTGLRFDGRRAVRAGAAIESVDGALIGVVTSGSFSPSLEVAVAMAYLDVFSATPGTAVIARSRKIDIPGVTVTLPFYARGSVRDTIAV